MFSIEKLVDWLALSGSREVQYGYIAYHNGIAVFWAVSIAYEFVPSLHHSSVNDEKQDTDYNWHWKQNA